MHYESHKGIALICNKRLAVFINPFPWTFLAIFDASLQSSHSFVACDGILFRSPLFSTHDLWNTFSIQFEISCYGLVFFLDLGKGSLL